MNALHKFAFRNSIINGTCRQLAATAAAVDAEVRFHMRGEISSDDGLE